MTQRRFPLNATPYGSARKGSHFDNICSINETKRIYCIGTDNFIAQEQLEGFKKSKCGEVRSRTIMDPGNFSTKVQGDTFKIRAPGRRSHESCHTLAEAGSTEPIKDKTFA